jgi:hypothetical protein
MTNSTKNWMTSCSTTEIGSTTRYLMTRTAMTRALVMTKTTSMRTKRTSDQAPAT